MDNAARDTFVRQFQEYFGSSPLPLCMFYRDEPGPAPVHTASGHSCLVALLKPAVEGRTVTLGAASIGCNGGKRYAGFAKTQSPHLAELLSCGIPGELVGLRYKKSPDVVRAADQSAAWLPAPAPLLVIKRIDTLDPSDTPEVVAFLCRTDVLAGLVHLAAYDTPNRDAVISPQGAGCATLLAIPRLEAQQGTHRAVLGMFDLSARPFVDPQHLSLAVSWHLFQQMAANMAGSFLTTDSWRHLRDRSP